MAKKKIEIELDGAKKVIEVPEPLKRKCELKQVLPVGVIQLLASAPHNDTIRNVLLAHLKQPVPDELKTFKDIQDWIEFNIDPPEVTKIKGMPVPFSGRATAAVQVQIVATDREHGSCSYSQNVRGRGSIPLTRDAILEAAANADDVDDFWSAIRDQIYNRSITEHINMDVVDGSETYDNHDVDDRAGIEVEIQQPGYDAVKEAIRTLDPEQYERLFE